MHDNDDFKHGELVTIRDHTAYKGPMIDNSIEVVVMKGIIGICIREGSSLEDGTKFGWVDIITPMGVVHAHVLNMNRVCS